MQIKKSCRESWIACGEEKQYKKVSQLLSRTYFCQQQHFCTFCWTPLQVKGFRAEIVYSPLPNPHSRTFTSPFTTPPAPPPRPTLFLILVAQSLTLRKHFLVSFLIEGGFSCGNNNIAVVAVEESSEQFFGRLRSLKSKQHFSQPHATTFHFRSCVQYCFSLSY